MAKGGTIDAPFEWLNGRFVTRPMVKKWLSVLHQQFCMFKRTENLRRVEIGVPDVLIHGIELFNMV